MQKVLDRNYFLYEPSKESEIYLIFGLLLPYLDDEWVLDESTDGYPDCIFIINGKQTRVEFELNSANFIAHGHDPDKCDMIVCWKDNWPDCNLGILELSKIIKAISRKNIIKNDFPKYSASKITIDDFYNHILEYNGVKVLKMVKGLLRKIDQEKSFSYRPGTKKSKATLRIYANDLSTKIVFIGLESTHKYDEISAWIRFDIFNDIKKRQLIKIREYLKEPKGKWPNIPYDRNHVEDLFTKIETIIDIMKK